MSRRLLAICALVLAAVTIGLAVAVLVAEFPRGLLLVGCVLIAGAAAWYGVLRHGPARVIGLIVAGLALVGAQRQRALEHALRTGGHVPLRFRTVALFTAGGVAVALMTVVLVIAQI